MSRLMRRVDVRYLAHLESTSGIWVTSSRRRVIGSRRPNLCAALSSDARAMNCSPFETFAVEQAQK